MIFRTIISFEDNDLIFSNQKSMLSTPVKFLITYLHVLRFRQTLHNILVPGKRLELNGNLDPFNLIDLFLKINRLKQIDLRVNSSQKEVTRREKCSFSILLNRIS
jgi:hypothetical protein